MSGGIWCGELGSVPTGRGLREHPVGGGSQGCPQTPYKAWDGAPTQNYEARNRRATAEKLLSGHFFLYHHLKFTTKRKCFLIFPSPISSSDSLIYVNGTIISLVTRLENYRHFFAISLLYLPARAHVHTHGPHLISHLVMWICPREHLSLFLTRTSTKSVRAFHLISVPLYQPLLIPLYSDVYQSGYVNCC